MRLVTVELNDESAVALTEIPSATTLSERKFALHYASAIWDGKNDVFENGPLLGGATRALAMGMLANENRDQATVIRTYDWWNARVPLDVPDGTFDVLASRDPRIADAVAEMNRTGSFQPVFVALAELGGYRDLIVDSVGYLPGHRGELASDDAGYFSLLGYDGDFSLAFIDGCKSWYGTRFWLSEIAAHLPVGAHILFQDYGWHTCFWIPTIVGLFPDCFELRGYVDHTYAFEVVREVDQVRDRIPNEPEDLGRRDYDAVFDPLLVAAQERGDRLGILYLSCQKAAAYAYIGLLEEAVAIIDPFFSLYEYWPMRPYLKSARAAPTYRPDGERILLP